MTIIRTIKPSDLPDLDSYFGPKTIYKNPLSKWEGYLRDHESLTRIVKVVEIDEQVIGIGTLKFVSDYPAFKENNIPEINDILIAPAHRCRGLGRKLVESIELIAKEKSYKAIGLAVGLYQDYGRAQRLYIKMGYIPDGKGITYKNQYVTPGQAYSVDDELLLWMIKPL